MNTTLIMRSKKMHIQSKPSNLASVYKDAELNDDQFSTKDVMSPAQWFTKLFAPRFSKIDILCKGTWAQPTHRKRTDHRTWKRKRKTQYINE